MLGRAPIMIDHEYLPFLGGARRGAEGNLTWDVVVIMIMIMSIHERCSKGRVLSYDVGILLDTLRLGSGATSDRLIRKRWLQRIPYRLLATYNYVLQYQQVG